MLLWKMFVPVKSEKSYLHELELINKLLLEKSEYIKFAFTNLQSSNLEFLKIELFPIVPSKFTFVKPQLLYMPCRIKEPLKDSSKF